jgi:hypothetical protein
MSGKEPIKDFYGRIQGWVETKPNGDKIGYDFYNRIVGFYTKSLNITQDFYRRIVAKGDALVSLIMEAERARK